MRRRFAGMADYVRYVRMLWWVYLWLGGVLTLLIEGRNFDARLFGVDFSGAMLVYLISVLLALIVLYILPPFWWLLLLLWRLRSRPLVITGALAAVLAWLALYALVLPRVYGAAMQLAFGTLSVTAILAIYRYVMYRQRKRAHANE
jgi:hypothetical protein